MCDQITTVHYRSSDRYTVSATGDGMVCAALSQQQLAAASTAVPGQYEVLAVGDQQ